MVKAQVKGYSMQSDAQKWSTPPPGSAVANPPQSHNPSGLKRPRSSSIAMESLPVAPKLRGDIILEVFTHRSLRFPGAPINEDSEFGDNERLAVLGEKVLELAVTFALFTKRPMLKSVELEDQRHDALSNEKIENWVVAYKMREKVRCGADAVSLLSTPKEARHLFYSYVGGIYAQNGMEIVQNWIGQLVDPQFEPQAQFHESEPFNAYKKVKTEAMSPPPPSMPPPPAPIYPPPPMPIPTPTLNPLAPAQPQTAFLPLFNQTANQRRLTVEYPAQFSGPAHAGRWTVQCVVNSIPKGEGIGASKQLAKEEAARQAYYAMGWAPRA
ncbi:ribonuclease III domain-containing protein [Fomitopsis betulina]|nr:ribonuclease III domain-containing protein [Fomitopsis betulina]